MDYIKLILENQLTAANLGQIGADLLDILTDHDNLIRNIADYVLEDKAGRDEARKNYLGLYYDEVQAKVNWIVKTAEEVWSGKYGNDEERRSKLSFDYDVVMKQVNRTKEQHTKITISGPLKYNYDGKMYTYPAVVTSRGLIPMYGFAQHSFPQSPWKFNHNGCGFFSYWSVIKTRKSYTFTPAQYAEKMIKKAGGTNFPISMSVGLNMLKAEGIKYEWFKRFTTQELVNKVKTHLLTGNPVIISLYKDNRAGKEDKKYTDYAHYAVLTHMHSDGKKAWLNDSGDKKPRLVDLWDICDHCLQANEKIDIDPDGLWNGWKNCGGVVLVKY